MRISLHKKLIKVMHYNSIPDPCCLSYFYQDKGNNSNVKGLTSTKLKGYRDSLVLIIYAKNALTDQ